MAVQSLHSYDSSLTELLFCTKVYTPASEGVASAVGPGSSGAGPGAGAGADAPPGVYVAAAFTTLFWASDFALTKHALHNKQHYTLKTSLPGEIGLVPHMPGSRERERVILHALASQQG